ncbi:MAG: hypothetical protein Q7U57_02970 [Methylovulum sp.]|nr:hypothetical protein [Methylovulum sp.]
MKKLNYLLIALCILVIVVNGAVFYSGVPVGPALIDNAVMLDASELSDPEIHHAHNEIERLKETVTAMEGRLKRTEAIISQLRSDLAHVAETSAESFRQEPMPNKTLTTAEIERLNSQQREHAAAALTESFQMETMDSAWAPKITGMIQDSFLNSEKLAELRLIHADCRATLCRIEVTVDNPEQMLQFEAQLPTLIGAELPRMTTFTEEQGDGSSRVTVYLARKGYKLP